MAAIVEGDRGRRGLGFVLLTEANRYVSRLPSLPGAKYYKLATPRTAPARFGQYVVDTSDTEVSFGLDPAFEHFLFGLSGVAKTSAAGVDSQLGPRQFAYIPPGEPALVDAANATFIWLKRRYEAWPGLAGPGPVSGDAADVPATETAVPGLLRRELIDPTDPAFDFNMSLMAFDPGVALHQIEIHDEEHGLYMTAGDGDYHLGGDEYPVAAHDFIYMAPYCPQGFRAGSGGAEYLLYKDVYRDGF